MTVPRASVQEKKKSHDRILEAAARLLREKGVGDTSVSDVMQAAGLTHGGFYRHFTSKDDLVAQAFQRAVDELVAPIRSAKTPEERERAQTNFLAQYLSTAHIENSGTGCPLASLGAELPRMDPVARESGAAGVAQMAGLLGAEGESVSQHVLAQLAVLIGSITLARLTRDQGGGLAALEAGKTALRVLNEHR